MFDFTQKPATTKENGILRKDVLQAITRFVETNNPPFG